MMFSFFFECDLLKWFTVLSPLQIGDIPDAEIKPPDNVLFVCKLNPVTEVSAYFVFSGGDIFM